MQNESNLIGNTPSGSRSGSDSQSVITTASQTIPASTLAKVLFLGWGRSGKDEAAQFAELHLGLRYAGSTSWAAKEEVAKALGVHPQIAYDNRHKNRQFWKDHCDWLRRDDPSLLVKWALKTGEICTGCRDKVEVYAAAPLFDHLVWVDREGTPEDFTVTFTVQDVLSLGGMVLTNDGSLEEYHTKLIHLFRDEFKMPVRLSGYAIELLEKEAKRDDDAVLAASKCL
jgi:hypothetical protein